MTMLNAMDTLTQITVIKTESDKVEAWLNQRCNRFTKLHHAVIRINGLKFSIVSVFQAEMNDEDVTALKLAFNIFDIR